jgi:hypothetical protein
MHSIFAMCHACELQTSSCPVDTNGAPLEVLERAAKEVREGMKKCTE